MSKRKKNNYVAWHWLSCAHIQTISATSEPFHLHYPTDILIPNPIHFRNVYGDLHIFISATSFSSSCHFLAVSKPNNMATFTIW